MKDDKSRSLYQQIKEELDALRGDHIVHILKSALILNRESVEVELDELTLHLHLENTLIAIKNILAFIGHLKSSLIIDDHQAWRGSYRQSRQKLLKERALLRAQIIQLCETKADPIRELFLSSPFYARLLGGPRNQDE